MSQSFSKGHSELVQIIDYINQTIPLVTTGSRKADVKQMVITVSEQMKSEDLNQISPHFRPLGTTLKILVGSDSPLLTSVTFQGFLLEMAETLSEISELINSGGIPDPAIIQDLRTNGEFLIKLAGRMLYRYKIQVYFEPDYDAKVLRAFMLAKDLSKVVRFLNVTPDISQQTNPNLDNGITLEVLSASSPQELNDIVMNVLSVESCQIFIERKESNVIYLDPPYIPGSVDDKMEKYLNE